MQLNELKPCPFCGSAPKLHEPDKESGHQAVECVNKECVMSHMWPDLERWNRRANSGGEVVAWYVDNYGITWRKGCEPASIRFPSTHTPTKGNPEPPRVVMRLYASPVAPRG